MKTCALVLLLSAAGAEMTWSPQLLHDPALWRVGSLDQAVIGENGLRLTVREGHNYELVAQNGIRLPENTGLVRVRVRELGSGAKWFLKIRGDMRGTGRVHDLVPFYGYGSRDESVQEIDPRLLRLDHKSVVQVQLGLEGPPGAWVVFESVEFLPSSTPTRRAAPSIMGQNSIETVERMPSLPQPYGVLLPWGTLAAVRMNAELGRNHDTGKLIRWCFDASDCRDGWAVVVGNWGGYDCSGLLGSITDRGGYAFAMNTFAQAAALVPLVRYDAHYARAIGKWMLNLSNAARLFYPRQHPPARQSSAFWKGDPAGVIAYEGLRYQWDGKFIARDVSNRTKFTLPADRAAVLVITPAGRAATRKGRKLAVDNVVVEYAADEAVR